MLFNYRRRFCGGYTPDPEIIQDLKVAVIPRVKEGMILSSNENQGTGRIKGSVKRTGDNYAGVPVCCFRRSNRLLLWETTSKNDGSYEFRNIAVGLECFVVAFDPNEEYNAVISDKVVAK
ncbi:carboxypeptidase regulatory-like domain-containing protein [Acinetobacter thermotolerans]|uniref:carboxypeptidase regulatory-like domain-containing protein n=1 Tax=Acinetobacter thermotolerans TaxID=3151487 RepID=UPI00325A7FFC